MLKIKDEVDLKELEKYGFKFKIQPETYCYKINSSEYLEIPAFEGIEHYKQIRLFIYDEYYNCWTSQNSFDKLYELIKADLVEKVED